MLTDAHEILSVASRPQDDHSSEVPYRSGGVGRTAPRPRPVLSAGVGGSYSVAGILNALTSAGSPSMPITRLAAYSPTIGQNLKPSEFPPATIHAFGIS